MPLYYAADLLLCVVANGVMFRRLCFSFAAAIFASRCQRHCLPLILISSRRFSLMLPRYIYAMI